MKPSNFTTLLCALPLAAGLLAGCKKDAPAAPTTSSFAMEMETVVGANPLTLGTQSYTKADGQTFTVSKFKYLLSNVTLTKADGTRYTVPNGYYVVDAEKPASSHFLIDKVPIGDYTGMSFMVGVDGAHNNDTFQSGDLNHSNDLYWEWSKEYVFLKMAGTSPQASAGRALTFDIGGSNCARTVTLGFNGATLPVKDGHVPEMHLSVDLNSMFESMTPAKRVNFTNTYSVESGSSWAPIIADNYAAGMFGVEHIHAN